MSIIRLAAVKPRECAVAYCLPRTAAQFAEDLGAGGRMDFASAISRSMSSEDAQAGWDLKLAPQTAAATRALARLARLGVTVNYDVGLDGLEPLFARSRVVTIIAHSPAGGVELRDGIHSAERVAAQVPVSYSGVVDLSICTSMALGDAIRARCPAASVPTRRDTVTPVAQLLVYEEIVMRLARVDEDFVTATVAVHRALAQQLRERRQSTGA